MDTIKIENLQYITIGREGEHNAETIPIDMTSWVEEFEERGIDGISYYILFKPYDSNVALPVVTEWSPDEDNILRWTITLSNTYTAGVGYAEVRAVLFNSIENNGLELGLVKKSRIIPVTVDPSASGVDGGTVPAPYDDWVNLVLATEQRLNQMFEGAVTTYYGTNDAELDPKTVDDEDWQANPVLTSNYMWSRIEFEWTTGSKSYFYTVSYLGLAESGVQSVNGSTGVVTLTGANIQQGATAPAGTIQAKLNSLDSSVTTLQSGKLDVNKIVYSATEPAKVAGTIWLKPKG